MFSFLNRRKDARIRELIEGSSYEDLPPHVISDLGSAILVTTEQAPSGIVIESRIGMISAEVPVAMHLLRPLFQRAKKIKAGRSPAGQRVLREARQTCETELRREALILQADAVIGASIDYRQINGLGRQILLLSISGTAVRIAKPADETETNTRPAVIAAVGE